MSGTSIIKNPKILVGETVRSTAVGTLRISHRGTLARAGLDLLDAWSDGNATPHDR